MRLLLLTGMSGAGKNSAFKILEDIGYDCVDNLPIPLLRSFVTLALEEYSDRNLVVGIDARAGKGISEVAQILDDYKKEIEILYLDADDATLMKRYKETRRTHPLTGPMNIQSGIYEEREATSFLLERADYIIDTTHLLVRDLKEELTKIFLDGGEYKNLYVTVMSFGFKYGIPIDADLVFDVRFLPNPFYIPELQPLTGNDKPVRDYVMDSMEAKEFVAKLEDMVRFLIPNYIKEGKNQLVICIGCTGGKHRSVTLANELYKALLDCTDVGLRVEHRDIEKDRARGK